MKDGVVYIMGSVTRTIYIGVTSDLQRRVWEHHNHVIEGFTRRYDLTRLVYYEVFSDMRDAIAREKQLKGWSRPKKLALIKSFNPDWQDLTESLFAQQPVMAHDTGSCHPERTSAELKDREHGEAHKTRSLDRLGMTVAA